MSTLTAENVNEVFEYTQDDFGLVTAEVLGREINFNADKLAEKMGLIKEMLLELPDEFMASKGGGWSFLNACITKHGDQWTGLHMTMARLFALGNAIGVVTLTIPPDLWEVMKDQLGGMPYYTVLDNKINQENQDVADLR